MVKEKISEIKLDISLDNNVSLSIDLKSILEEEESEEDEISELNMKNLQDGLIIYKNNISHCSKNLVFDRKNYSNKN